MIQPDAEEPIFVSSFSALTLAPSFLFSSSLFIASSASGELVLALVSTLFSSFEFLLSLSSFSSFLWADDLSSSLDSPLALSSF